MEDATLQQPEPVASVDMNADNNTTLYKKLFFGLLALILVGGIGFGAYLYGRNQKTPMSQNLEVKDEKTQKNSQEATPSTTPTKVDTSIVPITDKTVSFARINGKVYLKYKGIIYDDTDQNEAHKADITDDGTITWYGLVDRPAAVDTSQEINDQLFSFKVAPNGEDFVFIMRWNGAPNSPQEQLTFPIYVYDLDLAAKNGSALVLLATYPKEAISANYSYPKIMKFDPQGERLALNMFGCWNCGGHQPETLLIGTSVKSTKNLGKTSVFNWLNDGKYQYKEYKVIACGPEQVMGECSEKPETLPFIDGEFLPASD